MSNRGDMFSAFKYRMKPKHLRIRPYCLHRLVPTLETIIDLQKWLSQECPVEISGAWDYL